MFSLALFFSKAFSFHTRRYIYNDLNFSILLVSLRNILYILINRNLSKLTQTQATAQEISDSLQVNIIWITKYCAEKF